MDILISIVGLIILGIGWLISIGLPAFALYWVFKTAAEASDNLATIARNTTPPISPD